jgi:hypothetical protein
VAAQLSSIYCKFQLLVLCPFAVYYLRYAVTSFFTISRISLADGKRAGQKVHRNIAAAVQNVKPLYFLSRWDLKRAGQKVEGFYILYRCGDFTMYFLSRFFEIREKYCQHSFLLF